ncbi:MAG TPA: hypothetical protein VMI31_07095 [Fimbriimonadaceae bacterium]|nr:hypothetical protein [Fimbriimonadaceae bacterium]
MKQRIGGLIGSLLIIVVLSGCGTPGAPSLPSLNLARPVDDLTASRRGDKVNLNWTLPRKNTDHTNVKRNPITRVCRNEGTTLMATCTVVAEITPPTPRPPEKEKGEQPPGGQMIHYVDKLPYELGVANPAGFVMYAVEEVNSHGRSAGLSNQVAVPIAPTIAAPQELTATVSAQGVTVSWSGPTPPVPPAGVTYLYRIMRRPVGAPGYIALDDVEPSANGSYLDKTFSWEQKYEYRITTVSEVHVGRQKGSVEGDDSEPVEILARDIYPPGQPAGLQAVFSSVGQKPFIDLTWAPNLESDLAGYNVYRWTSGTQPQKLNTQLIQTSSYRDEAVQAGTQYFYVVTAVDARGNESPRSSRATETVPAK